MAVQRSVQVAALGRAQRPAKQWYAQTIGRLSRYVHVARRMLRRAAFMW